MSRFLRGSIVALAAFFFLCAGAWAGRWELTKWQIARKFPGVPRVTCAQLAAELAQGKRPLLLDARTAPEFAVSHLQNARRVDPEAEPGALVLPEKKDAPIVVYCSVGYRSAALAQKLRRAGFSQVRNLEGSIFEWANEGRPLFDAAGPAQKVHPFNNTWGRLLAPERRAGVPPIQP